MAALRWRGLTVTMMVLVTFGAVWAEEPAAEFLEKLLDDEYYDAALMYLDRMEQSPLASADFRDEIAYQRGLIQVKAAVAQRDGAMRERYLTQAKESLENDQ